jgi:thioesterase domain-containing protein
MRKRMIDGAPSAATSAAEGWLDLEGLVQVEFTSEEEARPVESALLPGAAAGWQAAEPGKQTLRLLFDEPLSIRRVFLLFREKESTRTQEFVLNWAADVQPYREIVRQQFNFSPAGATREAEDFRVELDEVRSLELRIVPDIAGGAARATLEQLRLA